MVGRDNDAWCMEEEGRDGVRSACTRALMAPGTRLEDDIKQQVQRSVHCHSRWMSSCGLVNRPPTPSSSSTPYSFPPRRHVSLQKRPTRFVLRTASCTKASASFPHSNHLDRFRNRIIVFVIRIREIFHFTNRILAREKIESKGANKRRKGKTNRREIDRLALERARIPRPCLLNIPIAACINVYSQIRRVEIESAETGRLSGDGKLSVKRDSSPPILMDPYPLEPVCSS